MDNPRIRLATYVAMVSIAASLTIASAPISDCDGTSVGLVPLDDLGTGLYLGQFQGGLYPGGSNTPPAPHANAGRARALAVGPLDTGGNPDPGGKIVLLSVGMSNTTQEFCSQNSELPCDAWTFMGQAALHPAVDQQHLVLVNGARGGQAAATWDSPLDPNYDRVRDTRLAPQGLAEAQVQAVWVKVANPNPGLSLPSGNADARTLVAQMGDIARALKVRYPNLNLVFYSSRIYAGYASTTLNPEPYSYESGFAVKWLIEAQIDQMNGGGVDPTAGDLDPGGPSPWIGWGPYLWADGLVPRSDGVTWACTDFQNDGTHPAMPAEQFVGNQLLQFMLQSPFSAPWFRASAAPVPALPRWGLLLATLSMLAAGIAVLRIKGRAASAG